MNEGLPATLQQAVATRWRIFRLVPSAGIGVVFATVVCDLLLGLLPVGFIVATSAMLGRVPAAVAAGAGSPEWAAVVVAFLLASGAFAAQHALAPVQTALGELVARRVDGQVHDRLMAASMRSPGLGPLEDQRLRDELSEATHELEQGFQSPGRACAGLLHLLARVTQLIGYVVAIAVAFSWLAALAVLITVQAFRYGQRGGLRKYSQVSRIVARRRRTYRYLRDLALQAPAGKEIRVFGLLEWLWDRYRRAYLDYLAPVWRRRRRIMLWPYFWYTAFGLLATVGVLVALGAAASAGTLALANLALVIQAFMGALRLGEFYPEADVQTQFGMNAYEAVRAVERGVAAQMAASGPPPLAVPSDGAPPDAPASHQEIRFSRVTFRYPGQPKPVIDGLDLVLPAGQCTAIVGVNGAGKTTLVKLLTRLYEPEAGRVMVNGIDIRRLPLAAWRARVAAIFQDFNRYEASAADNIGFGAVERLGEREQIRAAAAAAGVLESLDALPDGLDTPLARHLTGGVDLSGGQWQRVALARALFRLRQGGGVLVLDEPTASLDVRAEAWFFREFADLTRGLTTVLISHRFSTVRHADRIVVLSEGRVIEQGSHAELIALRGRYAALFQLQADRFVGKGPLDEEPAVGPVGTGEPA